MSPELVLDRVNLPEMGGHCRLVVGDKNAPVLRRNGQHGGIVGTGQTGGRRGPEIDLRGSSERSPQQ